MTNQRGSVLLQVMVTAVLVGLIAASLLRMSMLRYRVTSRSALILQEKRDDQQMLAQILGAWNSANGGTGQTCASVPITGYTYSGSPGTCGCSYKPSDPANALNLPTFNAGPPSCPLPMLPGPPSVTPDTCPICVVSADR